MPPEGVREGIPLRAFSVHVWSRGTRLTVAKFLGFRPSNDNRTLGDQWMFGFFKRKQPLSRQDDFRALMQDMHRSLLRASELDGIERHFAIATLFGAAIPAIRQAFPDVPIEDDSPAMTVLSSGGENPDWERITSDVEYSIQQARDWPDGPDGAVTLIASLLAPQHFNDRLAEAQQKEKELGCG
jgi:hypothetical protein